jgi:hypothetical protein
LRLNRKNARASPHDALNGTPMIEYKKFIYLDVYKTGSTHINFLLKKIVKEKPVRVKRHSSITKGRPFTGKGGKLVFATVRNPWDWYVSMWAYGHTVENPLYEHIKKAFGQEKLNELYEMDNPSVAFPKWLRAMHDQEFLAKALKGHRLPSSGLMPFMGFYTYRFMRVTMPYPEIFLRKPFINSMDSAVAAHRRWKMYDVLMRSETLDQEFADFAAKHGPELGFSDRAVDVIEKQSDKHRNVSKRTLDSYRDYYTDELRDLVASRDRFFIDLFGYTF